MRFPVIAALVVACLSTPASAQDKPKPIEVGFDGQVRRDMDDRGATTVSLPLSRVRVGWHVSEKVSIEPMASFFSFTANGSRGTSWSLGVGVPISLRTDPDSWQPYFRPSLLMTGSSSKSATSSSTFSSSAMALGVGLGVRVPVNPRLAWRFEGAYENQVGDGRLVAYIGMSFFPR